MAFVTSVIAISITVASVVYQVRQAKKAKEAAARAADAAKGFQISVEAESRSLPVVYGRQLIAGVRVYHNVSNSYTYVGENIGSNTTIGNNSSLFSRIFNFFIRELAYQGSEVKTYPGYKVFSSNMEANLSRDRNNFLYIQQAICHGPIHDVIDWALDDQDSDTEELKFGQRIHFYFNGGVDPMVSTTFSERASSSFPSIAYASMVFNLNRDDPQYSGPPNVSFYIEGKLVRPIIYNGSTYSLGNYTYTNNPSWCLLDYLLDTTYGRGLSFDQIDAESFVKAAEICSAQVQNQVLVQGRIWEKQNITRRDLPLYECNIILDTEKPIRDNIISLLSTMGDADLIWSGGTYKLKVQYPRGTADTEISGFLGNDDIVRSSNISVQYPTANERMNFCTIKFLDEALNFKENSASWPPKDSTVYQTFISQDNNIPLENVYSEEGISDKYHALAKAEELVRVSRSEVTYSFKINLSGIYYEPGDIVFVNSSVIGIIDELLKIREIKVNADGTANITAVKFDPNQLAWNAQDDQIVPVRNNYNFTIPLVLQSSIQFIPDLSSSPTKLGILTWAIPADNSPSSYVIDYRLVGNSSFINLGISSDNKIEIINLPTGLYEFAVRTKTTLGSTSTRVISNPISISDNTEFSLFAEITDNIVLTTSGLSTNLYIQITSPAISGFLDSYEVEVKLESSSNWINLGRSKNNLFEYPNVIDSNNYEVRVRLINRLGNTGPYWYFTHTVVGKSAPPSNVTGLSYSIAGNTLSIFWNSVNDLDLDFYEIIEGDINAPSLRELTKETFFDIINPTAGTKNYYLRALDTSGNYSQSYSLVLTIDITPPEEIILQSSLLGENIILEWNEPNSLLPIEEYLIEDELGEIARIKSTRYTRKVDWGNLKQFSIQAIDVAGNLGIKSFHSVVITPPPATTVTAQVIDNNVLLRWSSVKGTLPTLGYEVRKGNNYNTSQLIGFISSEFSAIFESSAGLYTYWVTARDSANNLGESAKVITQVAQPPDFELAADYNSPLLNTKVNGILFSQEFKSLLFNIDNSQTWNSHFIDNSWSDISSAINAGYSIFIQPTESYGYYEEVFDYGTVLASMKVTLTLEGEVVEGNPTVSTTISLSEDGITYTDYPNLNELFSTNFRYIKFKIEFTSANDKAIYRLNNINLLLSAKIINDAGNIDVLASDTTGTVVSFNKPFVDISSITVTPNSSTPVIAIYDFLDQPNPTSFKILAYDLSGNRVNANVSWAVKGY